jgi:hypothetical protein
MLQCLYRCEITWSAISCEINLFWIGSSALRVNLKSSQHYVLLYYPLTG